MSNGVCSICGSRIYFAAGRWLHETTPWDPPHPAAPAVVSKHELRRLAEQAAASADDTTDPVTVGRAEWLALLDAIETCP